MNPLCAIMDDFTEATQNRPCVQRESVVESFCRQKKRIHQEARVILRFNSRRIHIKALEAKHSISAPHSQGLYKLLDSMKDKVLYLGETKDLRNRLATHRRTYKSQSKTDCSFVVLPASVESYQRRELENDLIGGYYSKSRSAPSDQFGREI
jgi:hypothetical protein